MQNVSLEQLQQQQQLQYLMQNDASFQNEKTLKLDSKSSLFKIRPSGIVENSNQLKQLELDQSTANHQQSLRTIERQAKISLQQSSLIRTNNRTNERQKEQQIRPQQQTSLLSLSPSSYDPNNEPIYSNSSLFKPKQQMILPAKERSQISLDERRNQNGSILSLNHPSFHSPYVMYSLSSRDQTNLSLEQISMNPSIPSNTRNVPSQLAQRDQMMRNHRVPERPPERDSSLIYLRNHQRDSSGPLADPDPQDNFAGRRHSALAGSNHSIYNELQVPSASNFGSMKRKKKSENKEKRGRVQDSSSSDSSGVVSQQMELREEEYSENNVKIWSLQYIPQVFSVSKKAAKV